MGFFTDALYQDDKILYLLDNKILYLFFFGFSLRGKKISVAQHDFMITIILLSQRWD